MNLQSFPRLFFEPFDPMYCRRFQGFERTCWADTAWGECGPNGGGGGQGAYDLIMQETDVRIQYKLREGCGKLKPEQCLAEGGAPAAFEGAACADILRAGICSQSPGETDRFRTCVGQGQCACPAAGEPGHAEGAEWGLSTGCTTAGLCKAGCAAAGQPFTGAALTPTQLSDLATGASEGETKLTQAMDKLAAHISGAEVMSASNLATQSSRVEEYAVLLKRTPALVTKAFDLVDTYEASGRNKQTPLATKNLLEDTDGLRRPP